MSNNSKSVEKKPIIKRLGHGGRSTVVINPKKGGFYNRKDEKIKTRKSIENKE